MSLYACGDIEQVTHIVAGCRRTRVGDTASAFMPTRQTPVMNVKFLCFLSLILQLTDRLNIALFMSCICCHTAISMTLICHMIPQWECMGVFHKRRVHEYDNNIRRVMASVDVSISKRSTLHPTCLPVQMCARHVSAFFREYSPTRAS